MSRPAAIDLFAGGGGVTRGLIDAGFDVIASIERDEKIAEVHADNFGKTETVNASVFDVDYRKYAGIDHLHASPPCQNASRARSANLPPHKDKDAGLVVIPAIDGCYPKTVSIENVEGYKKSPVYGAIVRHLQEKGYWVIDRVVNFARYGVPQNRRRLITIASRVGIPSFPYENPRDVGWYSAVADLLPDCPDAELARWQVDRLTHYGFTCLLNEDGRRSTGVAIDKPSPTVMTTGSGGRFKAILIPGGGTESRIAIGDQPSMTLTGDSGSTRAILVDNFDCDLVESDRPSPTLRSSKQGNIRILLPRDGANPKSMKPIAESDPAPTIRAGGTEGDRHSHLFDSIDSETMVIKKLTPRCLARLQSFPDDYRLPDRSGLAVKIIGNSVPPLAMETIGRSLLNTVLKEVSR